MIHNRTSIITLLVSALITYSPSGSADRIQTSCQKFLDSDPVKRFVLTLFDSEDGIDQACAHSLKITESLDHLNNTYSDEMVTDREFRASSSDTDKLATDRTIKQTYSNQSGIKFDESRDNSSANQKEIPIKTVKGFKTIQ